MVGQSAIYSAPLVPDFCALRTGCCRSGYYCYSTGCCQTGYSGCEGNSCCAPSESCCSGGGCCRSGYVFETLTPLGGLLIWLGVGTIVPWLMVNVGAARPVPLVQGILPLPSAPTQITFFAPERTSVAVRPPFRYSLSRLT